VLNAKGREIKVKATGSTTTCEFFEKFKCKYTWFFDQNPLIAKTTLLWGRNLIMGKRGSFWLFDQN
jgi:hypothetical protein